MQYDLFISYSRQDNLNNRVTELKEKIEAEYFEFAKETIKLQPWIGKLNQD
jgi:hypothetical protein